VPYERKKSIFYTNIFNYCQKILENKGCVFIGYHGENYLHDLPIGFIEIYCLLKRLYFDQINMYNACGQSAGWRVFDPPAKSSLSENVTLYERRLISGLPLKIYLCEEDEMSFNPEQNKNLIDLAQEKRVVLISTKTEIKNLYSIDFDENKNPIVGANINTNDSRAAFLDMKAELHSEWITKQWKKYKKDWPEYFTVKENQKKWDDVFSSDEIKIYKGLNPKPFLKAWDDYR
jgi:hypothetical protein